MRRAAAQVACGIRQRHSNIQSGIIYEAALAGAQIQPVAKNERRAAALARFRAKGKMEGGGKKEKKDGGGCEADLARSASLQCEQDAKGATFSNAYADDSGWLGGRMNEEGKMAGAC